MKKGFLSLEYILLVAVTLTSIGVFVTSGTTLYTKNIKAIDDFKLNNFEKNINNSISLISLNPNSKKQFYFAPLEDWNFKKTNLNCLSIKNKQSTKEICSSLPLSFKNTKINGNTKIILENKNNTIYLNFQSK